MRFGKNVLSQNLRSDCELALYLTLFREGDLARQGLPVPLAARPGIGALRDAGFEQEDSIFTRLAQAFGENLLGRQPVEGSNRWRDLPLKPLLVGEASPPLVLVQPRYRVDEIRDATLARLGTAQADLESMPRLEDLIPDLVLVETSRPDMHELSPSGARLHVVAGDDRRSLSIVDVKHAAQPNPSYEAEVVLYGIMLANWLLENGLETRYFVNAHLCLWTGSSGSEGALQQALECGERDPLHLLSASREEFSPVNAPIYVQAVRNFFAEKLPAIIRRGAEGWQALDWHVGPRCASCDWLGYEGWLSPADREKVTANPDHYCFLRARTTDHLSQLPLATRGSCRVLANEGYGTVSDVSGTTGEEPVYRLHTVLRTEKRFLPEVARAIATMQPSTDPDRTDGGLARNADMDIFISVNFDPGAGILTGIGLQARFTQHFPYDERDANRRTQRWNEKWVVAAKSKSAEQGALLAFLQLLASVFEFAGDTDPNRGGPHAADTHTQFVFWDRRQFEELCLALGRHLPAILYDRNQDRLVKALTWIFPPEELQEAGNIDVRRPGVAFVRDVARRLVRVPAMHAFTLFGVVEHYHLEQGTLRMPDNFYREPLSDMIPRERIYEIWQLSSDGGHRTIRWGHVVKTLSQLLDGFGRTIDQQGRALSSLTRRLRDDFRFQLRAEAPKIQLKVPAWTRGVAHDAKLWIAWERFEHALGKALRHNLFLADPDETEARYESLRLTRLVSDPSEVTWEYEVSPDSLNTKLRAPNQFLCLAVDSIPGFAALPARTVVSPQVLPDDVSWLGQTPMHVLFSVSLESLDRVARRATIRFNDHYGQAASKLQDLRDFVVAQIGSAILENVTLMGGLGTDVQGRRLVRILRAVGNPPIAVPAPEARTALGTLQRAARPGRDAVTPIARVLWAGATLYDTQIRSISAAQSIAARARELSGLNDSQTVAVQEAAKRALTVIWGPPGTGKTQTCRALLHSVVLEAADADPGRPYAILVTGPTYRAVGEIVGKLAQALANDRAARCRLYLIHSRYRDDRFPVPSESGPHLEIFPTFADASEPDFGQMASDLAQEGDVVIVAAVAHQCPRIAEQLSALRGGSDALRDVFDLVVIDESSQVDMSIAVGPLALLKPQFQLIVVGDQLQMPPVFVADPPTGAEHLVGSLQTYLIERFAITPVPLLANYRSHHDVVAYTRSLGYPNALIAANPDTRLHLIRPLDECCPYLARAGLSHSESWSTVLDPAKPIVAISYPDGMAGQANSFEADCVASIGCLLRAAASRDLEGRPGQPDHGPWDDAAFWTRGLGIVTPHRAQRAQVVQALLKAFPGCDAELVEGAVDTVERFQGSERHTIIISFGVGDPDVIRGEERFLLQLERTNVAISRAMAKCIVFVSAEVASHIPDDRRAAETAHALRGVIDEWCSQRITSKVVAPNYEREISVRWH